MIKDTCGGGAFGIICPSIDMFFSICLYSKTINLKIEATAKLLDSFLLRDAHR